MCIVLYYLFLSSLLCCCVIVCIKLHKSLPIFLIVQAFYNCFLLFMIPINIFRSSVFFIFLPFANQPPSIAISESSCITHHENHRTTQYSNCSQSAKRLLVIPDSMRRKLSNVKTSHPKVIPSESRISAEVIYHLEAILPLRHFVSYSLYLIFLFFFLYIFNFAIYFYFVIFH